MLLRRGGFLRREGGFKKSGRVLKKFFCRGEQEVGRFFRRGLGFLRRGAGS